MSDVIAETVIKIKLAHMLTLHVMLTCGPRTQISKGHLIEFRSHLCKQVSYR